MIDPMPERIEVAVGLGVALLGIVSAAVAGAGWGVPAGVAAGVTGWSVGWLGTFLALVWRDRAGGG